MVKCEDRLITFIQLRPSGGKKLLKIKPKSLKESEHDLHRLLFSSYYKRAYRFAHMIVKNHSIAEDIVQDSFIRAFQNLSQLKSMDDFLAWFSRIIYNTALRLLEREKKIIPAGDCENIVQLFTDKNNATEIFTSSDIESKAEVREVILQLDEKYREIIFMRFYWDLPYEQIAEEMSLNIGTVKSRLSSAKEMLQCLLQKNDSFLALAEEGE